MFKISKKAYKFFYSIYIPAVMLGMLSQNTFIPSQGYKTFSSVLIWILAIWITIVSIPYMYMKERAKKQFLVKSIPTELLLLIAVIVFAHFNALLFFKSVPLLTKHFITSERIINYSIIRKGTRDNRAILACDQFLKLDSSSYYGKLCIPKKIYDVLPNRLHSIKVSEKRNIFGSYIDSHY